MGLRPGTNLHPVAADGARGGGLAGAGWDEKSPQRLAQRDGYRDRLWEIRAGTVEPRIPKLREGSCSSAASVVQEAYVPGLSTRSVRPGATR